jgi:enolase-phosphatase E1
VKETLVRFQARSTSHHFHPISRIPRRHSHEKDHQDLSIPPFSHTQQQFPYALRALPTVLATQWDSPNFAPYRDAFPTEHRSSPAALEAHVRDLTARDVKAAYHKNLQGYLWEDGYASGAYATDLFADVVPCLKAWRAEGRDVAIYSSGSVFAQKLLMRHVKVNGETEDLEGLVSGGWFDTVNAGLKGDRESYERISGELKVRTLSIFSFF